MTSQPSDALEVHFTLAGSIVHAAPQRHDGHDHAGPSQTYSISALLRLARSSISAQRAIAYTLLTRIVERHLLAARYPPALAVVEPHLEEIAGLAVAALGISETSTGVTSGAILLLDALAGLAPGPLRPPPADLIMPLLGGLRRVLAEQHLDRSRLETILGVLKLVAAEADVARKMLETPELLEAAIDLFASVPWPSSHAFEQPSPLAPSLLGRIVGSSRDNARALLDRRATLLDPFLRYLVSAPYGPMLVEVLRLWTDFARYGLAADLRTSAGIEQSLLALETYATNLSPTDDEVGVVEAWYDLVGAWTACATDPHHTEPPHAILWTHVEEWFEPLRMNAVARCRTYLREGEGRGQLASSLDALAVWLEGARINEVAAHFAAHIKACDALFEALRDVLRRTINEVVEAGEPADELALLAFTCDRLLEHAAESGVVAGLEEVVALALRSPSRLLHLLVASLSTGRDLPSACSLAVLLRLHQGDGYEAQRLAQRCLVAVGLDAHRLKLLKPFIVHVCTSTSDIAPLRPRAATLPLVHTLRPSGHPLVSATWPLACVVEELLASATSDLVRALPVELSNEAALVEAGLAAASACWQVPESRPPAGDILIECMKVFMLEKDVAPTASAIGPLYSQPGISFHLDALLMAYSLERSDVQLGTMTLSSFPDFYVDFLELYAATSLGDPLFGRFLLAPLATDVAATVTACARTLFHGNAPLLRTLTDEGVRGHPALERRMAWSEDEVVQGAMIAALRGGEVSEARNGLLVQLLKRQVG